MAAPFGVVAVAGSAGMTSAGTATSTVLNSDFNPTHYGQSVTLTATVTPSVAGVPTGTVTFSADSAALSSASVAAAGVNGSVSVGGQHTCATTNAGAVRCWGANAFGQLGDNTQTQSTVPVDVGGLASGVASIAAGLDFTCALTTAGGVKCWGHNNLGQLGDTTDVDRATPVDVSGLTSGIVAISAGHFHACALTNVGAVKCWGANSAGQLGDNSGLDQLAPVDVTNLSGGVASISAGSEHTCAVTTAGGALCWGSNAKGSIGDGTNTDRPIPTNVSGLTSGVSAVAAGMDFTCAITGTGVKCWGDNVSKQLGDGSTSQRDTPVPVSGLSGTATALATGGSHACMLNSAGALKCWGANSSGQLGNGQILATSAPVSPVGFVSSGGFSIAAGSAHTCAVDSTAALRCWGLNANGQIGDGSINLADAPNDVTDFAAGTMLIQYRARLSVSSLTVGTHTIAAHYDGDATFDPSDAPPLSQAVILGATTTSVGPSPSPAKVGQSVTFHIVVTRVLPATGTPGGTVTIDYGDGTAAAVVALAGGVADSTHSYAAAGSYNISANYGGDSGFGVSSAGTSVTVTKVASSLGVTASPNPAKPGQIVTFTATLTVASGSPTGTVTFTEGATTLGSAPVSANVAKFATSGLAIGSHKVRATYAGDAMFTGSANATGVTIDAKVGAESRVNTATAGSQQLPAIASLKSGYVVVWSSNLQDGSGYGIYAQRYNLLGTKLGAAFLVNTETAKDQVQPAIARLSDGGFAIVWQSLAQDGSDLGVYGQRYTALGAKAGGEFRVNTAIANAQSAPAVAGLSRGGFVVVWQSQLQDKSGSGIYAQRYDARGKPAGVEFRVNQIATNDQAYPTIAALTGGGFTIAWQSDGQDGSGLGVYARQFDSAGIPTGREFRVNKTTAGNQSLPSAAALNDGGFVIAWQSHLQDGSGLGVYAQRFGATGAKAGAEFRANTTTANNQSQPCVAGFGDGGFVIAWSSLNQDKSGQGVYAQAYKATGAPANVEFRVNTVTLNDQWQPAVAAASKGVFMAVWTSKAQDGSLEGVYAQFFQVSVTP